MKLIITLCVVIVTVVAVEQEPYKVPPEYLNDIKKFGMHCALKYKVDSTTISKIGTTDYPETEATKNFLYCFGTKSGYVDKEGHIVVDKVFEVVKDHERADEFKEALQKCAEITKDDPVETVNAERLCYIETSPLIFEL